MADPWVRLRIAYDGGGFAGFQAQPGKPTVQATIEEALWRLTGTRQRIRYAGRTDTGVHALEQVIALDPGELRPAAVLGGLNSHLPPAIAAWQAAGCEADFDPRRQAVDRTYRYLLLNRDWPSPFLRPYAWSVRGPLDETAMREAAGTLLGTRDFAGLADRSGAGLPSTVRMVREVALERAGDLLLFEIRANAFLPHMVRNVVGTLVAIGQNKLRAASLEMALQQRDRRLAGPAAPGHGLCLARVAYPPDIRWDESEAAGCSRPIPSVPWMPPTTGTS